jgi:hypothetical protein
VSDRFPNLDALLEQLAGDTADKRDARELAEAVASASTDDEIDAALAGVIGRWRQP